MSIHETMQRIEEEHQSMNRNLNEMEEILKAMESLLSKPCKACNGTGRVETSCPSDRQSFPTMMCWECDGTGRIC